MKNIFIYSRFAFLRKLFAVAVFLISSLASHSQDLIEYALLQNPFCGHPVLFIPDIYYANISTVTVNVNIQYEGLDYPTTTIFNTTVNITNTACFQSLGSITIAGVLEHAYRFTYASYSVGPAGSLTEIDLQANNQSNDPIISSTSFVKSCHPCNTCPSRLEMSLLYSSLSNIVFNTDPFPDPSYNGSYASLTTPVQQVLATVMDWVLDNNAPVYADYIDILDPDSIGNSIIPPVFCQGGGSVSCICRNQFYNQIQAMDDSLELIGLNTVWFNEFLSNEQDSTTFYCNCWGDFWFSITATPDGNGYEVTAIPLDGNIPAVASEVYFDGGTPYATIAYSNFWTSADPEDIIYTGGGTFSYDNGFAMADTTFGPCDFCQSVAGTSVLQITMLDDLQYQFQNTGALTPDFTNWYLDGNRVAQTLGNNPFVYSFETSVSMGYHRICMQAAYLYPGQNGDNLCCYDEVCDSVNIDSCALWKATDTITYQADPNLWYNVNFTFQGYTGIVPTLMWSFGDESPVVIGSDQTVSHTYPNSSYSGSSPITYNVCVYVVWSLGINPNQWSPDSPGVCCCIDTICFNVLVGPCNDNTFIINRYNSPSSPSGNSFMVTPSGGNLYNQSASWTLDGANQGGGYPYFTISPGLTGTHIICATINYSVYYSDGSSATCQYTSCLTYDFGSDGESDLVVRYYPNPAGDQMTVEIDALNENMVTVEISDLLGRPLLSNKFTQITPGTNYLYMYTHDLLPDLYEMKVTLGDRTKTLKVMKQ